MNCTSSSQDHRVVHVHPALRRLDTEFLETEPLDVRPASRRNEQPFGVERRAVGQVKPDARLDPLDPDPEADVDPLLPKELGHQLTRVGMDAPEQVVAAFDDRHL